MNYLLGALVGLVLTIAIVFLNRNRITHTAPDPKLLIFFCCEAILFFIVGFTISWPAVLGYATVRALAIVFIGIPAIK